MKKYKRGITFGAYEIFHQGHFNLLKRASAQCEKLTVCISSDEYIEEIKGHKSVIRFELRQEIIFSMPFVDDVASQDLNFGKREAVKFFKPDVIFVGDDWNERTFKGEGLGIPVIYLPRTKGISSTLLRKKL